VQKKLSPEIYRPGRSLLLVHCTLVMNVEKVKIGMFRNLFLSNADGVPKPGIKNACLGVFQSLPPVHLLLLAYISHLCWIIFSSPVWSVLFIYLWNAFACHTNQKHIIWRRGKKEECWYSSLDIWREKDAAHLLLHVSGLSIPQMHFVNLIMICVVISIELLVFYVSGIFEMAPTHFILTVLCLQRP